MRINKKVYFRAEPMWSRGQIYSITTWLTLEGGGCASRGWVVSGSSGGAVTSTFLLRNFSWSFLRRCPERFYTFQQRSGWWPWRLSSFPLLGYLSPTLTWQQSRTVWPACPGRSLSNSGLELVLRVELRVCPTHVDINVAFKSLETWSIISLSGEDGEYLSPCSSSNF